MASLMVKLLHLLLAASAASSQYSSRYSHYYRFFGGSLTFTPKGQNPNGTYKVELHNKQGTSYCQWNPYLCFYGNCGTQTGMTYAAVSSYSFNFGWCHYETVTELTLDHNLPFGIRYPAHINRYYGQGFWAENFRGRFTPWRMMAHVDLGTRSDTGRSNRSPITTTLPLVRVTRNCPRSFNLTAFDPDGDRVRCRIPTSSSTYECGLCGLSGGFSLDQSSCSLVYRYNNVNGYLPIELVVEDFPNKPIWLSYSDGSYTVKHPHSLRRRKRQISPTTAAPTTAAPTTAAPTTAAPTTAAPTTYPTTTYPTTTYPTTTYPTTTYPTTTYPTTTYPTTTYPTTTYPTTTYPTTTYPTTTYPTTTYPTTTYPTTTYPTTTYPTTTYPTTTYPTTTYPTTTYPTTTYPTTTYPTTTYPTTTVAPTMAAPTIAALSKLPLQFSVFVDSYDAPSCLDGDYFPIFLSPTPSNGVNLPAFVNNTLEIKVKSRAQYATIVGLIVTGPKGISKQRISTEEYVIKWTPAENALNDHFPICFISEARERSSHRVYQSELRCVIVDVGHYETTVTCNETTITVEVEKSYLLRRNEDNLHLNDFGDASCNLSTRSNATHLVAVVPLNMCGTVVEEGEDDITFQNKITSADLSQIISRQHDVEILFSCVYPKRTNLTLEFRHKNPYAFKEKGFGAFTFQFEFFESQRFRRQVNASTYPVEVDLKQMMFMQIEATTSIPDTQLFVESCRATPYDNPNSRIGYTIIEHGCARDQTVQIYPSARSQFRFGMEAFEFIGAHAEVYITCSVLLCEVGVSGTRCSQGCMRSNSGIHRVRRAAAGQTSSHFISQGPLRLVEPSDGAPDLGLSLNLGLNLVFVGVCLVACGAVIYRVRRSKAKYEMLPSFQTD